MTEEISTKGQGGGMIMFTILLSLALFAGGYYLGSKTATPTGNIIDEQGMITPAYEILRGETCGGKDLLLGPVKATCTLTIQNKENTPIELAPTYECYTLNNPEEKEQITTPTKAITSKGTQTFDITYDNKNLEWQCNLINANPQKIRG